MRYEEILGYVEGLVGEGDEIFKWVYKRSDDLREEGVYQIDPGTGRLVEMLTRLSLARSVLEIGSGAGYSTLWFMKGMSHEGILDAIELNPKVALALEDTARKAGLGQRIRIHQGLALAILPKLQGPYDIVFIDADKEGYPKYLEHALRVTRLGSLILAHNMFMGLSGIGGVISSRQQGIPQYTEQIFNDHRLLSLIVPIGDGLAISHRVR